jgi:hypothetical protein
VRVANAYNLKRKQRERHEEVLLMPLLSAAQILSPQVDFEALIPRFRGAVPFDHVVIDNFFSEEVAAGLVAEFPEFSSKIWWEYENPIEIKKACNIWDKFPKVTYSVFDYLNSPDFVNRMSLLVGEQLYFDPGLHGGGWHTHRPGGKLNTHLDYSIHPKLGLERRLNLIVYIQPNWELEWGGSLGLWAPNEKGNGPGELMTQIPCLFNRAVIFDTSQNSWHGLPEPVKSAEGICRNSMATYYLCEPRSEAPARPRALFAPHGAQTQDESVLDLIKKRSQVDTSASVYKTK